MVVSTCAGSEKGPRGCFKGINAGISLAVPAFSKPDLVHHLSWEISIHGIVNFKVGLSEDDSLCAYYEYVCVMFRCCVKFSRAAVEDGCVLD